MNCSLSIILKSLDEKIAKTKKSIKGLEDEVKELMKETNECRKVIRSLKEEVRK